MIRLGFAAPINQHSFIYKPRSFDEIEATITRPDGEIAGLLKGLVA